MFNLFMRKRNGDIVHMGTFKSLANCHKAVEMKTQVNYVKCGKRKSFFYCKDLDGNIAGTWVMEAE